MLFTPVGGAGITVDGTGGDLFNGPLTDIARITGVARADQGVTLSFYWGFEPGVWCSKETDVSVPASDVAGGGKQFAFPVVAPYLRIAVVRSGGSNATTFRCAVYQWGTT